LLNSFAARLDGSTEPTKSKKKTVKSKRGLGTVGSISANEEQAYQGQCRNKSNPGFYQKKNSPPPDACRKGGTKTGKEKGKENSTPDLANPKNNKKEGGKKKEKDWLAGYKLTCGTRQAKQK